MYDPTAYPFVRARTYVDANPPAVLSDEFYNPTQDAIARLTGGAAGYSTSITSEEFVLLAAAPVTPAIGDLMGTELAVLQNPGAGTQFVSTVPSGANQHGVYRIYGVAAGARTGGFEAGDGLRWLDTRRWIFHVRIRCSNHAVVFPGVPGIVVGLGNLPSALPSWVGDGGGFWRTFWDGGSTLTAIPTVDDEWVDLWIANRDADGKVRWYLKRDTDLLPVLIDTQTLTVPLITAARRYVKFRVTAAAVAADNLEIDTIELVAER